MFHLDEAARLDEWEAVVRVRDNFLEVSGHLVKLLAEVIVARNRLFVRNSDGGLLLFFFLELCIRNQPLNDRNRS